MSEQNPTLCHGFRATTEPTVETTVCEDCGQMKADHVDTQAGSKTLQEMISGFNTFFAENLQVISELEREVTAADPDGSHTDDFFFDQIAEMKTYMGGTSANDTSDDEEEQEDAISEAENWVTNNVSPTFAASIAAVLWMEGVEDGTKLIRDALKK
jgi:hypothetical protein